MKINEMRKKSIWQTALPIVLAAAVLLCGVMILTACTDKGDLWIETAKLDAVWSLAWASGANGMVAGQVLDLTDFGHDHETLTTLCDRKTCFMIKAAAELGCAAANASPGLTAALALYASRLGLAFQIRDDVLDVVGDEATFGKPIGSDKEEGKTTFVDLLGVDGCEREVRRLTDEAVDALRGVGDAAFLTELARRLTERTK